MKFYQMLDHKFSSELRATHFKNQTEEATLRVYDRELSDYSKIIPKLKPDDWKHLEIHFDEKTIGWKFRLACCLKFADLKRAFPLWQKLIDTGNSKIQAVVKTDLESRKLNGDFTNLTKDEADFLSLALQHRSPPEQGLGENATKEPPDRFRNNVYSQKNLKLELLLWRWKMGRSTYFCLYGSDKVIGQWTLHLNAGIELAEHFGEALRIYSSAQPTPVQMEKIGSAFFLKSMTVVIFDEKRHPDRKSEYVIDSEAQEITLNLELEIAREMKETVEKRKNLWIEPPYIGWDLLPDVLSEEVFLLPSLPDKDGEWIKR